MFDLGNNLREARHRRQIDLVVAEQDTKIRSKYLAALETEDFDVLPGPVFVRGFLRTYSRYLGLDPQLFVDEYNARFGRFEETEEHQHTLGRPGLAAERESRGRRTMRMVAIGSLVAIAVLAWLGLRQGPASPGGSADAPATRDVSPSDDAPDTGPAVDPAAQTLGIAAREAQEGSSMPATRETPRRDDATADSDDPTAAPR